MMTIKTKLKTTCPRILCHIHPMHQDISDLSHNFAKHIIANSSYKCIYYTYLSWTRAIIVIYISFVRCISMKKDGSGQK